MTTPVANARRAATGGFTLLETLVALVVVSMIVVVLMQALQQALALRARLLRYEAHARTSVLQEAWFRDTVRAAIPDIPEAIGSPEGTLGGFAFVTAAPLTGEGLAWVSWSLVRVDGGFALDYASDDGTRLRILEGPLRAPAFAYMDDTGAWHEAWNQDIALPDHAALPVREGEPPPPVPLPRMVRLHAITTDGELTWLVPVVAEPLPPERLRPEDYGLGG